MREILFRGQLRRKGEKVNMAGEPLPSIWKYGGCAQYSGGAVIYQSEPEIQKFSVYGDTVGQYTGLKDKNGVKIFEGDIVLDTANEFLWIVIYDDGRFWGIDPKGYYAEEELGELAELMPGTFEGVTVIGNIYDNPELLEVEQNGNDKR